MNRGIIDRLRLLGAALALVLPLGGTFATPALAAGPTTWHVTAGGASQDMSLMGMAFYPGVITIDEGDTVTWTDGGMEPHTVSFLSGAKPPAPGSPESLAPAGDGSYDGTGVESSGMLLPGKTYSLKFTKAGVYVYICELHPGMQGVVVVQPAGSAYPMTQAQYDAQAKQDLAGDLAAVQQVVDHYKPTTEAGPNGTTIYHVAAGLSTRPQATIQLAGTNGSQASGTATLAVVGPGKIQVDVSLTGLAPNSKHPEHIHGGTCAAGGGIVIPLPDLVADASGRATMTTTVDGPFNLPADGWFLNVHTGPTMDNGGAKPIACGDLDFANAGTMRFHPGALRIHQGDKVVWTVLDGSDAHTVTFLDNGQKLPSAEDPMAAAPAGGDTYAGKGFHNSGIMPFGQSYALTFTQPGKYTYVCLLHAGLGMAGTVQVVPASAPATLPKTGSSPLYLLLGLLLLSAGLGLLVARRA